MSRNLCQIWDMRLSEKLTKLKARRGVSDREVARSLGDVSAATVRRWMNGEGEPSLSQAVAVAAYFGVPLSYLAYGDASLPPGEMPADEAAVLRFYRSNRAKGILDEDEAIVGMAGMLRKSPVAPVILSGQAALDAIAASEPILDPPQVVDPPKRSNPGRGRRKA